jgi:hypothetical protein
MTASIKFFTTANSSIIIEDLTSGYQDASAGEGSGLDSQTHIVSYNDLESAVLQCMEGGTVTGVDTSATMLAVQTTQPASTVLDFANVTSVIATFSN